MSLAYIMFWALSAPGVILGGAFANGNLDPFAEVNYVGPAQAKRVIAGRSPNPIKLWSSVGPAIWIAREMITSVCILPHVTAEFSRDTFSAGGRLATGKEMLDLVCCFGPRPGSFD
jgi:hypothetical protein